MNFKEIMEIRRQLDEQERLDPGSVRTAFRRVLLEQVPGERLGVTYGDKIAQVWIKKALDGDQGAFKLILKWIPSSDLAESFKQAVENATSTK